MLAMFEPKALPIAMPPLPRAAAVAETSSSGRLVPNPRMTTPMAKVETFSWRAREDEPSTSRSALQAKTTNPIATTIR